MKKHGSSEVLLTNKVKPYQKYDVTCSEDAKDTHCKTNLEAYQVRKASVKNGDVIKAVLAPGGGHCMWIKPIK